MFLKGQTKQIPESIIIRKAFLSRFLCGFLIIIVLSSFAYSPTKLVAYDDIENPLSLPHVFNHKDSIYSYYYNKKTREVLVKRYNAETSKTSIEANFIFPEDILIITWNAVFIDDNMYLMGFNEVSGNDYSYLINLKGDIVLKNQYVKNKYCIYLSLKSGIRRLCYYVDSESIEHKTNNISLLFEVDEKVAWKRSFKASVVHNYEDEIWVNDYISKKSYRINIETGTTIETYEGKVDKIYKHNQTRIVFVSGTNNKSGYLHYKNPKININRKIYPTNKNGRLIIDKKTDDLYYVDDSNIDEYGIVLEKETIIKKAKTYKLFINFDKKPLDNEGIKIADIYNGIASVLIDDEHYKMRLYKIETGELIHQITFDSMQYINMRDEYYIAQDHSNFYIFDYSNPPKLVWILENPKWDALEVDFKNKSYYICKYYQYPEYKFTVKCIVYDINKGELLENERYQYSIDVKDISNIYYNITPTIHGLLDIAYKNENNNSIRLYKPLKDVPEFEVLITDGYEYSFDSYTEDDDIVVLREHILFESIEKERKFNLIKGQFID